ncbi:hypothetical protein DICPUDRAFT_94272 [Dictyostelium purpureum]|uniref:CDP-alcohol phosphatidyltransferase n=1 Tax=Dictyostelium purpureum TaxID=5786 RepID=F0ZHE5_DICPU|nr:uncharacterized protein DICPUDRAFT_94272 [Dictyostelium purpureum]EGC36616.1 hypothetical protein DICPUDRAFT_94272 [Dictyostelium purpureum]|eukprot:XP_003286854.1 hypothetical protein DICPUDRAFT_94272 [Dictyostelium purpureum]
MSQYFKYVTEKGIANLSNYHYSGVDNSFCGNKFLKHWWNYCVEFTPLWLAPNVITSVGLLCNIGMFLIMYFKCSTLTEAAPRWCYFAVAFLIFAYQTLDNVDGKQARKTKSSSPLGELFDHVCDALSVSMFALVMSATLRIGPYWAFFTLIVGVWPFYLAHWEEYHAGILVMGEFNGPTEAQVLFIIIEIITGIFGSEIWTWGNGEITVGIGLTIIVSVTASVTCLQNFNNTWKLENRIPFSKCLLQLLPIVTFTALIVTWASVSRNTLLKDEPYLFIMTIGILFGYIQSRYITQRVCHDDCPYTYPIFIPMVAVLLNSIIASSGTIFIKETTALWFLFAVACIQFLLFAYFTTQQLCEHLKIKVFTIPYPSGANQQEYSSMLISQMEEGESKLGEDQISQSDIEEI